MPDIDMDFDERRRGDMIRYATEKYGEERVAQIITYGTIKAKAAIKDAARVLGYPFAIGDRITKAMPPPVMGKDIPLARHLRPEPPALPGGGRVPRALRVRRRTSSKVVDTAKGLEGLKRQWGVHAAGVILSRDPLVDVLPIQKREQDGAIITQWDMGACESIGLLKMDFLGLRNLTVHGRLPRAPSRTTAASTSCWRTCRWTTRRPTSCWPAATRSACSSSTAGRCARCCARWCPTTSRTSPRCCALYRPGPMGANAHNDYADRKNGRKPVVPIHPELAEPLAEILGDTYGLIVYQEQVMAIAQKVAGYSLGAADLLRRAMGKKKKEILDKEYVPFSDGMKANGYSDAAIKTLWDILVPFSDYAFNKAHTAGVRAGLLLDRLPQGQLPGRVHGGAAHQRRRRQGQVGGLPRRVPPHGHQGAAARRQRVRRPVHRRSASDIRFGLAAVRNVGANVVESIVRDRKEKGAFTDFYDFLRKVDAVACNKKTVESLIKAGAFDSLGHTPQGPARGARRRDRLVPRRQAQRGGRAVRPVRRRVRRRPSRGTPGMVVTPPIPTGEWDKTDLLAFEREMLGLYVSDHPLFGVEHVLAKAADMSIAGAHRGGHGRRRPGGHPRRHPVRRAAPDHQAGPGVGVGRRWRTSTARSRCCSSPTPTSWSGSTSPRTRSSWSRAGSTGATTSPG